MTNQVLLVGAAQVEITPPLPVARGGSFLESSDISDVFSPLTAQAVAWEKDGDSAIWTVCDVGNIQDVLVPRFRKRVAEQTGVAPERIHLSATHSHGAPSGPVFSIYRGEAMCRQVLQTYETMIDKAAEAAVVAYRKRRPARMGYGRGHAPRAAYNRRFIMSNGRVCMHGNAGPGIQRLQCEGPVDDQVQVVWFESCDAGATIAIMVNFASHPSQMYGMPKLGADYPGVMREVVGRALGCDVPILFLQGACGNVQPVDLENDPTWGRGERGIRNTGGLLAGEIIKIMHSAWTVETDTMPFRQAHTRLALPYRTFPEEEAARTLQLIREGQATADCKAYLDPYFASLEQKARAKAIALIDHLRRRHRADTLELSAIRLGEMVFVMTPAHQFVEFQIALKSAFPEYKVMLTDFTDGACNYVPTPLAIALGGYETEHRRYQPDAGDRIRQASMGLIRELLG